MPERPISLADVRQASRVYVRLPVDPYWREEGEELEDKASTYPGLAGDPDLPYPILARVDKEEAERLVLQHQSFQHRRIVGNFFDPFFFTPLQTGYNLYILRLHVDIRGDPQNERYQYEKPVKLDDVLQASGVYVRLRMVQSSSSGVAGLRWCRGRGRGRGRARSSGHSPPRAPVPSSTSRSKPRSSA